MNNSPTPDSDSPQLPPKDFATALRSLPPAAPGMQRWKFIMVFKSGQKLGGVADAANYALVLCTVALAVAGAPDKSGLVGLQIERETGLILKPFQPS